MAENLGSVARVKDGDCQGVQAMPSQEPHQASAQEHRNYKPFHFI
jgi:hypothetical protein